MGKLLIGVQRSEEAFEWSVEYDCYARYDEVQGGGSCGASCGGGSGDVCAYRNNTPSTSCEGQNESVRQIL